MSDASGTLWLDVKERKWSEKLLSCSELDLKHMPTLVEGNQETGTLKNNIKVLNLQIKHKIQKYIS